MVIWVNVPLSCNSNSRALFRKCDAGAKLLARAAAHLPVLMKVVLTSSMKIRPPCTGSMPAAISTTFRTADSEVPKDGSAVMLM